MANKDDYLTYYREFFENFAQTVNPHEQLPVKIASYKLINIEVVGGIIDWTSQYLTQKKCPPNLIAPLIKIVIEEIRKACKKNPVSCGFNQSDNAYEPLKLMQTVMAKTNEVCLRYLDNSMLCSLPSPGTPLFQTCVCAVKNIRRRMEDRHVVIHDLNTMFNIQEASPSSYYAIFDGHAGHDAAAYSSAHLHQFLAENKYFVINPEQALLDAFCKTDALFIDKCKVENLSSGTTAVVALLRPKEKTLYIAWVGDSQALLVNQGRILQVVNPHKPGREDEKRRIEERGGCVLLWGTWRVNGQLAVSRAIGDAEYKPYVTAVPDIREIPLDGGEDFLILACDGLWDFLSEDCAARAVYRLVTENPDDIDRISRHLVQLSREQGSSDNISVIVVFLREPSKIAADAHWANRNCTPATMEAGLDNANNPFAISNGGATTDNIITQKSDGLLLNLTDNFKQNGTDISPTSEFYTKEKSNGKRSASEFDDDDFGPETDVDAVDEALSPVEATKPFSDIFSNNNPAEGVYNPFMEHQEKAALEIERELQKQQSGEFEEQRLAREETPTPPADAVHDVSGLVDNVAESESEDEWNYFKGDEANKENISPQPDKEVAEVPEEEDNMSQLNPNAAEFVPISPTRSIPSPACRTLINDAVISQSPRRANDIDINLPNPIEFENEVKSRPSEVDSCNGHNESDHNTSTELMENLLNGKNIDEIPEFQPGSTPTKIVPSEEFHFGPNAAPFTPAKFLDQSEAALSTKAVFGDESVATLNTSFNESSEVSQETGTDLSALNKESDPMSMSFYADKGDSTPFDLNEVHVLPDNIDEFLSKPDNITFNDTISDLPEHYPLGKPEKTELNVNNDDAIQTADLDKQSYDDEKELASPLEPEKELIDTREECDFSRTPEPTQENLLFCNTEKLKTPEVDSLPRDVELISPEPTSPRPQSSHSNISHSKSPIPEATEVNDLLQTHPESLPRDVELISPEPSPRPSLSHEETEKSEHYATEVEDLLKTESKSPLPEALEVDDLLQGDVNPPSQEVELIQDFPESQSPESDILEVKSPLCVRPEVASDLPESTSPVCEFGGAKSPVSDLPESAPLVCELPAPGSLVCELGAVKSPEFDRPKSESPVCELPASESSVCELGGAKSPVSDLPESRSPVCEFPVSKSPDPELEVTVSPVCDLPASKSPVCELPASQSPLPELPASQSPLPEIRDAKSPISDIIESKSPIPDFTQEVCSLIRETVKEDTSPVPPYEEIPDFTKTEIVEKAQLHFQAFNNQIEEPVETRPLSAGFTSPEIIEKAEEHFNEFFKPQDAISPQPKEEEETPIKSPIGSTVIEDSFVADQSTLTSGIAQDLAGAVQETLIEAVSSPVPEEPVLETCPISPPKSIADTESVATADVNSFLERSLPPEVASPLSPTEQIFGSGQIVPDKLDLDYPLSKCVYSLPTGEEIDIKTENITPEFAEQTLVTPSEESKQEDVPTAPLLEEPVKEPVVEEKKVDEQKEEVPIVETVAAVGAVAAATAVVAAATTLPAKAEEKKKPTTSPAKKTSATKTAAKPTTKAATLTSKTASRLSSSPKGIPAKPSSTRSTTTSAPKPTATKPAPRPKPTTAPTKPADKKPLANGDVKSTVRSTLTARKTTTEATATKTTSRLSTGTSKLSPTKTATTKSPAAPKPTATPRVTAARTSTTTSTISSTAPKPRPTTLTHRTTTSTTSATPKTSTTPKTPSTKTSPKTASAPKPRPPPSTTTLSKPRVPLTKTVSKAPDAVKQNKESANKLTASKSVTSTMRTTSATSRAASTTTVRKIESKTIGGTRTMKTTTTTMKSTTAKKPTEIVRHPPSKTKTTKVEKPKENGISTVVTEEITVVNNTTSSVIDSEPQLIKDNSPVDNKLIVDNTLIQTNTAD